MISSIEGITITILDSEYFMFNHKGFYVYKDNALYQNEATQYLLGLLIRGVLTPSSMHWVPCNGEDYYTFGDDGSSLVQRKWQGSLIDVFFKRMNLVFRTVEELKRNEQASKQYLMEFKNLRNCNYDVLNNRYQRMKRMDLALWKKQYEHLYA